MAIVESRKPPAAAAAPARALRRMARPSAIAVPVLLDRRTASLAGPHSLGAKARPGSGCRWCWAIAEAA